MRYAKVFTKIWNDEKFQAMSWEAQRAFLYLMSSPHSNAIGLYVLKSGYACDDLRCTPQKFQEWMVEMIDRKMVEFDSKTNVLYIRNHMRYNPLENPNQVKGAVKAFNALPKTELRDRYVAALLVDEDRWNIKLYEALRKGSRTVSEPEAEAVTEKETGTKGAAVRVLQFLNEKAGRNYRPEPANLDLIIQRLKSGVSEAQCRQVIARKWASWKGTEFEKFMRPATLFNKVKFEQYVGELGTKVHCRE